MPQCVPCSAALWLRVVFGTLWLGLARGDRCAIVQPGSGRQKVIKQGGRAESCCARRLASSRPALSRRRRKLVNYRGTSSGWARIALVLGSQATGGTAGRVVNEQLACSQVVNVVLLVISTDLLLLLRGEVLVQAG